MFYLIYVSSAVSLMDEQELLSLLEQSRDKNGRLQITGMLLYKGGNFMQMLEGDKERVLELYKSIRKDERHRDVTTIIEGETEARNFENWSMGFANMDRVGDYPQYERYIEQNLSLREFQDDARSAYRFIVQFNETNR